MRTKLPFRRKPESRDRSNQVLFNGLRNSGDLERPLPKKQDPGDEVVLYTDGACSGNPGPGGWAAILTWNGHEKALSGFDPDTTNNRMELQAVIEGLRAVKKPDYPVRVITDSQYIHSAFTKGWLENWIDRGWRTQRKEPVKNKDRWLELLELTRKLDIRWEWTKGHAFDALNNRCDELARAEIERRLGRRR